MGWFDEQIRLRQLSDDNALQQAFLNTANAVLGGHIHPDPETGSENAVNDVLEYFHLKKTEVPAELKQFEDRMEYACRPHGIMFREVTLEGTWYKEAFGPMIGVLKEQGKAIALLPGRAGGYFYYDDATGEKVRLNASTAGLLNPEAYLFYRPLPAGKIGIVDLVRFALSTWSTADVAVSVAVLGLVTLLGIYTPKLSYFLFSEVVERKSVSLLLSTLFFMVCLSLSSLLFSAVRTMVDGRTGTKMSVTVQAATIMRILSLPTSFFKEFSAGEIAERAAYVSSLCTQAVDIVLGTSLTSLFSLVYITQIFQYAPALVIPSLCIIVCTVVFSLVTVSVQMKIMQKKMEITAANAGETYAYISGIQKIKLAGAEKRAFARWANNYAKEAQLEYSPPFFLRANSACSLFISLMGSFVLYKAAIDAGVGVAEYYAFTTAYGMVYSAFTGIVSIAAGIANIRPTLNMARPILETEPEVAEGKKVLNRISGAIELNNISFRYDDNSPNVLENLNLKIRPGQYLAIVGKTGCGKSTLIRLLLGFERPQKGDIFYDGKSIGKIDLRSLRRKIGVVMQNDKLFQGDIYSNIVISAPWLTLNDAWEAARLAGIEEDIRRMPMGMNTLISDGGGGISGGQRQRLIIARAIAPRPKILIFDEATSALDNITQKQVSDSLEQLKCTRIVVAHRLSTIRHCDRIIYLEKGRIVEDGTYEELMEKNGLFADLVRRQQVE